MTAPAKRRGDWIQTFTGRQFWPLDPKPEEISIIDIAAGLARECRFGGASLRFYSVAEHSVWMYREARGARHLPARDCRAVLLHDASEGLGLRDIPRPIKRDFANYHAIEDAVMRAVAARFDFDWPMESGLKSIDEAIGRAELEQIMAPSRASWGTQTTQFWSVAPLNVRIECWAPDRAMIEFLSACAELDLLP